MAAKAAPGVRALIAQRVGPSEKGQARFLPLRSSTAKVAGGLSRFIQLRRFAGFDPRASVQTASVPDFQVFSPLRRASFSK